MNIRPEKRSRFKLQTIVLCSLSAALPTVLQAAPLAFNWPPQQAAEVTETRSMAGKTIELQYHIRLHAQADGTFLLKKSEPKILSIDGIKPSPQLQARLLLMDPKHPDLLIAQDSMPLDIPQWDSHYQRIKITNDTAGSNIFDASEISNALKTKAMQEPWCFWVCVWANEDPDTFPTSSTFPETALGIPFIAQTTYRQLSRNAKQLTLQYTSTIRVSPDLQPETMAQSSLSLLQREPTQTEQDAWQHVQTNNIRKTVQVTATIRPDTLQPDKVEVQTDTAQITGANKHTSFTYRFRWLSQPASQGR